MEEPEGATGPKLRDELHQRTEGVTSMFLNATQTQPPLMWVKVPLSHTSPFN